MMSLFFASLFFVGTHLGVAGSRLRDVIVERLGTNGYLGVYSLVSVIGLIWMTRAYEQAPHLELWGQLYFLAPLALVVMFLSFVLMVVGLTTPSPTLVGADSLLRRDDCAKGILRVTRHPFMWGVGLWAAIHAVINGDLASLLLFGSLGTLAVLGLFSIDAKKSRLLGDDWSGFAAKTSAIPFLAIAQGRNRFIFKELGWWRLLAAGIAYLVFLYFHPQLFGVSPLTY